MDISDNFTSLGVSLTLKLILNERPHKCYRFNHSRNLMAQQRKLKKNVTSYSEILFISSVLVENK